MNTTLLKNKNIVMDACAAEELHDTISYANTDAKLNFKPITHSDMPLIWEFLERENGRTTDFSYGGLFMWVDLFKYQYAVYDDTLFISGVVENHRDIPAFSLPLGNLTLEKSIKLLKEHCRVNGIPLELSAVPEYALEVLKSLNPLEIELLEDWGDYLYDAEMLSTLHGKKMAKKRNHVNNFITNHPDWHFEDLTPKNAMKGLEFMKIYDSELDDTFMSKEESKLSKKLISCVIDGDRILKGGLLYSDPENVCGITIGDIKGDTLFVHVEKATKAINGSYEMINHQFAAKMKELYPQIKYINREDDSGDSGLRKAKESYHPVDILRKYNVIFEL